MGIGKKALSSGEAVVDRVLCVVGAVLFSQAPEFMQQYLQRLGGHLGEARRMLGQYEDIARQAGLSLDAFIMRTASNPDAVVARHATVMENTVDRVRDLAMAQSAVMDSSVFARPFVFLRHIDWSVASDAWSIYKPAVPTTLEGLLYGAVGIGVILGFYYGCIHIPITRVWGRRQARKASAQASAALAVDVRGDAGGMDGVP